MSRILCIKVESRVGFSPPSNRGGLKLTLQAVAARCKQFTPLVGIDPDAFPQSVLLDITRVLDLFGGEEVLVKRILDELRGEGWQFRVAVADTPGAAWSLAWYGAGREGDAGGSAVEEKKSEVEHSVLSTQYSVLHAAHLPLPTCHFPLRTSHVPLSSLPLAALRLPEPIIALLHSLGIWRVGELQALPRRELSSRFGPELLDCLDRVTGRLPEPLPAWDAPQQFEVRWSAEFPTARRETIDAALEHLVRRLAAMLTRAGRGAMRLECRMTCLGKTQELAVGLFRPTAWANHLLQLLQVRLESLQLPGPVETLHLSATTAALETRQQEMFAEKPRLQPYHLSGLIDRLSNRLGHARVARVRLIPEAQPELACHYAPLVGVGWCRAQRRPTKDTRMVGLRRPSLRDGARRHHPTRPLRLLTEPLRLSGGVHSQFSFAGRSHRIVQRIGPERIETGWWRGQTVARDYYRVETAAGCWYWLFRRLPNGHWFLHGMFD